jgi:5'-nucleotidase (lipoprotein e(P4) family)
MLFTRPATLLLLSLCLIGCAGSTQLDEGPSNNLMYAVAWQQTAAEYRALYHQGFNLARARVEAALASNNNGQRPLAVISDLDATLLDAAEYWGYQVGRDADFFDDPAWDAWIAENRMKATPGALEFLQFCAANGVEVFYVSNRDQGENTDAYALAHLEKLGFPYADPEHITILRETSNKQTVQEAIMAQYEVVVLLGDNLNDFSRRYYVSDVDEREALMTEDRDSFGSRYILFPNPTDGHWIRAIYGDSEPPASAQNRQILKEAAMRERWER